MRFCPAGWLARTGCLSLTVLFFTTVPQQVHAQDGRLRGVVTGQDGHPLPRVQIRLIHAAGNTLVSGWTDEAGRFLIASAAAPAGCLLEASLAGFRTAALPCETLPAGRALEIVLDVAPIRETVVVTATRTETPAGHAGVSVTTFTAEDLERRHVPYVADLLRTSPGVMLVRTGGYGGLTSLFVRGGESRHTKILLDGIPLNDPGGSFDLSHLSTEHLERVEVVRAAESALFGSDAMAGVVQLFTLRAGRASGAPRTFVSLEAGTYETYHASVDVSGGDDGLDYALGAARFGTDNREPNSAAANTTLSGNLGYTLGPSTSVRAIGRSSFAHAGTPGATAFGRPDLDASYGRSDAALGLSVDHRPGPRGRHRGSYSWTTSRQDSTNLVEDPPYVPRYGPRVAPFEFSDFLYDSRTRYDRHRASYQTDWRLASDASAGDHLLTALADWDGERATIGDVLTGDETAARRDNLGVSVQHQASWPRLFATVGGRFDHNDSFGTSLVPRASVVVVARASHGPLGQTRIRVSAGRGIKEPTVLQSFSASPFFLGNPDLEPERSRTVETGVEQRLAHDRLRIDVAWFDNRFEDLISTRITSFDPFRAQYFNVGRTRARGTEVAVDAAPSTRLGVRAGYTFLDSEILETTSPGSVVFQDGSSLFRRPRHSGSVGATLTWRNVTLNVTGVFVGRFVDSDFSALEPPIVENSGFSLWDVRVAYRLSARVTMTGSLDNATGKEYMEPLGYPGLGRAARGGVRLAF